MPAAVLNTGLLGDVLVGVVDGIRRDVRAALGTRPHEVAIVTRTWSSGRPGIGTPTDVVLELDPPPMVTDLGLRSDLRPAGREEEGDILLTEVSLRYTEAELHPSTAGATEWAYRITDAHGQQLRTRFYTVAKPLAGPRRGDHASDATDWAITLRRIEDFPS
jgi:hypothetical protein